MPKKKVVQQIRDDKKISIEPDDARIAMIQMLIPLGLEAVNNALQAEVERLVGKKYSRNDSANKRWGKNPGSVYLGGQKVAIDVPRVRNLDDGREVQLQTYESLQSTARIDDSILAQVINGVATRKYERVIAKLPETFGIKKSAISKKFIRASAKKLDRMLSRDISREDIVAIFMDGKTFSENDMILALGITMAGNKTVLGVIESASENGAVVNDFIGDLQRRGLNTDSEILFVIDGSKGLRKGILNALGSKAIIQRCQWHKRENVVKYLPKGQQLRMRKKLQDAYQCPKYVDARAALLLVRKELKLMNESAAKSLDEGLEETLTLHRLDLFAELGRSFKTTNCIENLNKQIELYTGRVCVWKTSFQRQRWLASAIMEIEPGLNKVSGAKYLRVLREQMKRLNSNGQELMTSAA